MLIDVPKEPVKLRFEELAIVAYPFMYRGVFLACDILHE